MMSEFNAVAVTETYRVRPTKAEWIVAGYREKIDPADIVTWETQASEIEVTDASQVSKMAAARELRLAIRPVRTAVEAKRKELKDDALQETKAIDGLGRAIRERLEAIETDLLAKEEFAKRIEAERERVRREEADRLLREKEERERVERETAEAAERERLRVENEKLRREREDLDRAVEAERQFIAEQRAKEDAARRTALEEERKRHAKELEIARTEAARLAALVKCPKCGNEFDGREHGVQT